MEMEEGVKERLFAEIRVLQQLKHKNIMAFYDWWYNPKQETMNFITELLTSGTLRQYRKKAKVMNENIIKRWAWQILEGLVYLHGHDPPIVHRDLKCDNVFVNGSTGVVKIGDLGLATAQQGLSVVGTPEFMAPEIYEETYDQKVDIYSFGMCLLELATLEYPYAECHGVAHIFKKVTTGVKPQALQRVRGDQLRELIELCIAHDAGDRPEARQLLKHPFFDSLKMETGFGSVYSLNYRRSGAGGNSKPGSPRGPLPGHGSITHFSSSGHLDEITHTHVFTISTPMRSPLSMKHASMLSRVGGQRPDSSEGGAGSAAATVTGPGGGAESPAASCTIHATPTSEGVASSKPATPDVTPPPMRRSASGPTRTGVAQQVVAIGGPAASIAAGGPAGGAFGPVMREGSHRLRSHPLQGGWLTDDEDATEQEAPHVPATRAHVESSAPAKAAQLSGAAAKPPMAPARAPVAQPEASSHTGQFHHHHHHHHHQHSHQHSHPQTITLGFLHNSQSMGDTTAAEHGRRRDDDEMSDASSVEVIIPMDQLAEYADAAIDSDEDPLFNSTGPNYCKAGCASSNSGPDAVPGTSPRTSHGQLQLQHCSTRRPMLPAFRHASTAVALARQSSIARGSGRTSMSNDGTAAFPPRSQSSVGPTTQLSLDDSILETTPESAGEGQLQLKAPAMSADSPGKRSIQRNHQPHVSEGSDTLPEFNRAIHGVIVRVKQIRGRGFEGSNLVVTNSQLKRSSSL